MGKKNIKYKIKNELVDLSFLLPAFLVFLFMILIPLIMGVRFTFTDWDGISDTMNFDSKKFLIRYSMIKTCIVPIKNTYNFHYNYRNMCKCNWFGVGTSCKQGI